MCSVVCLHDFVRPVTLSAITPHTRFPSNENGAQTLKNILPAAKLDPLTTATNHTTKRTPSAYRSASWLRLMPAIAKGYADGPSAWVRASSVCATCWWC
eukprot:m.107606 g.107606  ORF g.107606 m.107606 type:complete len:99 (+) comp15857_c0_seq3:24-320(+)